MAQAKSFFNEERVDELKAAFALKANADGVLPSQELGNLLRAMGLDPSVKEVIECETKADPLGRGTIPFDKFFEVIEERCGVPFSDDKLLKAFKLLQNPVSKKVIVDELKHYLPTFNEEVTKQSLEEFLAKIPCNANQVNVDGFVKELTT